MNPDLRLEEAIGTSFGADALVPGVEDADVNDVNSARADEYALLATLLLAAPDANLMARLSGLRGDAETPLGKAHAALGQAASSASPVAVSREYFELFIGVGRGELVPYASYYLTGFLNERPLARLRGDMRRLGLERADGHFDPEDHLGTLFEIMSGFAATHFVVPAREERDFFERHIAPWASRFLADLENAASARFYRAVGALGRIFIDIEAEGFAMEARPSS